MQINFRHPALGSLFINQPTITLMAAVMLSILAVAMPSNAFASPPPPVVDDCSALRPIDFSGVGNGMAATKVMSGDMVTGMKLTAGDIWQTARRAQVMGKPFPLDATMMPDHCVVKGYVNPHIKFELRLPNPENWNGRFLLTACDGFCGKAPSDAPMAGAFHGYAAMSTDGGHWGEHPFDGIWAKDNMQARIDFAHRANHVLLMAAKAIIKQYYGEEQDYSYLTGCSKGGHAGVMSALRYPKDFDGILSRDPTINYTKVNVLRCAATGRAVYDEDGNALLTSDKTAIIQKAVMAHCDGKDGLEDGMISNPFVCDFDPKSLQCGQPGAGPDCLSETETKTLSALYAPVLDDQGNQIYVGQTYGSEAAWPAWALPVPGDKEPIYALRAARDYLKYLAFRKAPSADYDWRTFDWSHDEHLLADLSPMFDADNPDLRAFERSGNKLMVIHGLADPAIPPAATKEWYDNVSNFFGGRDNVIDFARLFFVPGIHHCDGGVGPDTFDALTLLQDWVENDKAPEVLITSKVYDGEVERTRPVYAYPIEAKYTGRGSVDLAENFKPHDPRK